MPPNNIVLVWDENPDKCLILDASNMKPIKYVQRFELTITPEGTKVILHIARDGIVSLGLDPVECKLDRVTSYLFYITN